ncbi:MAG: hypothetical protein PVF18_11360 [Anaerolineales bacterium]|jgi:hypothetical protein
MSNQAQPTAAARTFPDILTQHQLKPSVERRVIWLLIISLLVMIGAFLWSVYRWYFAFARFGPAIVWRWSGPAIGLAFLTLLLAIYAGMFLIRNRKLAVYTTPDALWLINGNQRRALPWTEIQSIRSSAARYLWSRPGSDPQIRIWLRTVHDEVIKLPSSLTSLTDGIQTIKEKVYPLAMDRYRGMMKSGQALEFGPLELTRQGVAYRGRVEPWQNFREVHLENGRLEIEFEGTKRSRKISIPARRVPNVDLCVQLLRNIEY